MKVFLSIAITFLLLTGTGCKKFDKDKPELQNKQEQSADNAKLNSGMDLASLVTATAIATDKEFANELAASIENSYYLDENILFTDLLQPEKGTILKSNNKARFKTNFEAAYTSGKFRQLNSKTPYQMETAGLDAFKNFLIENDVQLYWPYVLHTAGMNKPITVGFVPADVKEDGFKGYQVISTAGEKVEFKEVVITDEFEKENPVWLITKNNGAYKIPNMHRQSDEEFQVFKKAYNGQISAEQCSDELERLTSINKQPAMATSSEVYTLYIGRDRLGKNPSPGQSVGIFVTYAASNTNVISPTNTLTGGISVTTQFTKSQIEFCRNNPNYEVPRKVALISDWKVNTRKQTFVVSYGWQAFKKTTTVEQTINGTIGGEYGGVKGNATVGYTTKKSVAWEAPATNVVAYTNTGIYRSLFEYLNYTSLNNPGFGGNVFKTKCNNKDYYERNFGLPGNDLGYSLTTDVGYGANVNPRSFAVSPVNGNKFIMKSELDEPVMGDFAIKSPIANTTSAALELRNKQNTTLVQDVIGINDEAVWTIKFTPNGGYVFLSKMSAAAGNKKYFTAVNDVTKSVSLKTWDGEAANGLWLMTVKDDLYKTGVGTSYSTGVTIASASSFGILSRYLKPLNSTGLEVVEPRAQWNNDFRHMVGPFKSKNGGTNAQLTNACQLFKIYKISASLPDEDKNYDYLQ